MIRFELSCYRIPALIFLPNKFSQVVVIHPLNILTDNGRTVNLSLLFLLREIYFKETT